MIKEIHGVLEDKAILEAGIEGHKIITEVNMNSHLWKEEEEEREQEVEEEEGSISKIINKRKNSQYKSPASKKTRRVFLH